MIRAVFVVCCGFEIMEIKSKRTIYVIAKATFWAKRLIFMTTCSVSYHRSRENNTTLQTTGKCVIAVLHVRGVNMFIWLFLNAG